MGRNLNLFPPFSREKYSLLHIEQHFGQIVKASQTKNGSFPLALHHIKFGHGDSYDGILLSITLKQ
jgi:hypothetical protein